MYSIDFCNYYTARRVLHASMIYFYILRTCATASVAISELRHSSDCSSARSLFRALAKGEIYTTYTRVQRGITRDTSREQRAQKPAPDASALRERYRHHLATTSLQGGARKHAPDKLPTRICLMSVSLCVQFCFFFFS